MPPAPSKIRLRDIPAPARRRRPRAPKPCGRCRFRSTSGTEHTTGGLRMGGLTTALLAATSGLRAAQTGIDIVSRNVANATTVGYTRKTVPQTPLIVGGEGQGVRLGDIERQVNARLQVEVRSGLSQTTAYGVRDDFLSRFEL